MTIWENNLIQRCFDLARLGMGKVSPNPTVGSVISTHNKIIGEGYHQKYGEAHAEVNAVLSMKKKIKKNLSNSTISVSLEPCNFHGNTPACTDLIIKEDFSIVNVSTIDSTAKVNSKGLEKLKANGKIVNFGIKESKGRFLARVRNTFVTRKRPYIILKYAQSKDGYMGQENNQVWLSNSYTKRLVHKWRSESSAIIIGTNTAIVDNPRLTSRLYPGHSPLRVIIDKMGKISPTARVKNDKVKTWIYTQLQSQIDLNHLKYRIIISDSILDQICSDLHEHNHNTLIVEGGAQLLNSFINAGLWDEARIITTPKILTNGIAAPTVNGHSIGKYEMYTDVINLILNPKNVIYS